MFLRISCYWLISDIGEQKRRIKATLYNNDLTKMAAARRKDGEAGPSPARTAGTSVTGRQGASVAHAGCRPGRSGLLVRPMAPPAQGKSQKTLFARAESGKLRIRGDRNWVRRNAADIAGKISLIPAGWGPKKD